MSVESGESYVLNLTLPACRFARLPACPQVDLPCRCRHAPATARPRKDSIERFAKSGMPMQPTSGHVDSGDQSCDPAVERDFAVRGLRIDGSYRMMCSSTAHVPLHCRSLGSRLILALPCELD